MVISVNDRVLHNAGINRNFLDRGDHAPQFPDEFTGFSHVLESDVQHEILFVVHDGSVAVGVESVVAVGECVNVAKKMRNSERSPDSRFHSIALRE